MNISILSPRPSRIAHLAACVLFALATAQACGPEFFPDTFVRTARPDLPKQFVQGQLGILQTGFPRADLFVAFRYLNNGTLDITEQTAWSPTIPLSEQYYGREQQQNTDAPAPPTSLEQWMAARKNFPGSPGPITQESPIKVQTAGGFEYSASYLNCADDAFRTATETLATRTKLWGTNSPYLIDWIHAQDIVFSNCSGGTTTPAPAPANSPAILIADRAYQTAAAHFYARMLPEAAAEFIAISNDHKDQSSPWQPISGYLAGRVLIRQAFFARHDADAQADYDPAIMQAAEQQFRTYLAANPSPAHRRAAEQQLALIRIRLEPEQRTRELAALVAGPEHDDNYTLDLQDLLWITSAKTPDGLRAQPEPWMSVPDKQHPGQTRQATTEEADDIAAAKRHDAFEATAKLRSSAAILDWTLTFQSLATAAPTHALDQWRNTHALPWLVAALVLAPNGTTGLNDLIDAAAAVPPTSPAWQTITYHRARLLLAARHVDEARPILADLSAKLQSTPAEQREPSSVNAVRGLEMLAAPTPAEFLSLAPRTMLLGASEEFSSSRECIYVMKDPARHYNCVTEVGSNQLDEDAARILNQQAPLAMWLAAAASPALSSQLRNAIAAEGWTRALLLGDKATAASLLSLAPQPLREQASTRSPLAPWMTLARNPGLRPYLNAGTQRAYSYDFVESYRDNWCYQPDDYPKPWIAATFLSAAEKQKGTEEYKRLSNMRAVYVGREIIRQVKANNQTPQAPEALFLVLRMIRYGCTEPASANQPASDPQNPTVPLTPQLYTQEAKDLLELKQDAARLLRRYYASSPWTKKAAPYVG